MLLQLNWYKGPTAPIPRHWAILTSGTTTYSKVPMSISSTPTGLWFHFPSAPPDTTSIPMIQCTYLCTHTCPCNFTPPTLACPASSSDYLYGQAFGSCRLLAGIWFLQAIHPPWGYNQATLFTVACIPLLTYRTTYQSMDAPQHLSGLGISSFPAARVQVAHSCPQQ